MKLKKNKYRCPHCKKIVTRTDERKWIKSDCIETGKTTRLILIKKNEK